MLGPVWLRLILLRGSVSPLDTPNFTSGMNTRSLISPTTVQWRSACDNDSFHYVMKGAESEQPVGAPWYQWVGCRDHAGITCFPHSGTWQVQGGPAYICREQRKCVFYDMGPLRGCPDENALLRKRTCIASFWPTVHTDHENAVPENALFLKMGLRVEKSENATPPFSCGQ